MPFIEKLRRTFIDEGGEWEKVGECCYKYYAPMIKLWKEKRRWTTAHNIFRQTFNVTDEQAAKTLAFLVFFVDEIMPYEREMKEKNGSIE